MEQLLALFLFLQNPNQWKLDIYDRKYKQTIIRYSNEHHATVSAQPKPRPVDTRPSPVSTSGGQMAISWYDTGSDDLTTACWNEYPKGTTFTVTYNNHSVRVVCTDRGGFKPLGRMLDLSRSAFAKLAPLSTGIIRGAKIEVTNK